MERRLERVDDALEQSCQCGILAKLRVVGGNHLRQVSFVHYLSTWNNSYFPACHGYVIQLSVNTVWKKPNALSGNCCASGEVKSYPKRRVPFCWGFRSELFKNGSKELSPQPIDQRAGSLSNA